MERKLSDILIEMAMQGLKSPRHGHSDAMHPLMFLASVAWNRTTKSPDYMDNYLEQMATFPVPKRKLRAALISEDWSKILQRMIDYKQARFAEDTRVITTCEFTERGTLRVEWVLPEEMGWVGKGRHRGGR